MLLAPAALLGVRGEVWVDADAASRCPMLTYRWIHQPGLLDLQLHSDTSVMPNNVEVLKSKCPHYSDLIVCCRSLSVC